MHGLPASDRFLRECLSWGISLRWAILLSEVIGNGYTIGSSVKEISVPDEPGGE